MTRRLRFARLFAFLIAFGSIACGRPHDERLMDRLRSSALDESRDSVVVAPVEGTIPAIVDEVAFHVADRAVSMTQYPCSSCHTAGFSPGALAPNPGLREAHWTIELNHAPAGKMDCATCHDLANPQNLRIGPDTAASILRADAVCGNCHFQQKRDWAAGAHGKRLSGWNEPRVVESCAGCHNPHSPRLGERMPASAGRISRGGKR